MKRSPFPHHTHCPCVLSRGEGPTTETVHTDRTTQAGPPPWWCVKGPCSSKHPLTFRVPSVLLTQSCRFRPAPKHCRRKGFSTKRISHSGYRPCWTTYPRARFANRRNVWGLRRHAVQHGVEVSTFLPRHLRGGCGVERDGEIGVSQQTREWEAVIFGGEETSIVGSFFCVFLPSEKRSPTKTCMYCLLPDVDQTLLWMSKYIWSWQTTYANQVNFPVIRW